MSHNLKGGWDLSIKHKTILSFNFETEDWNEEGNMLVGRSAHDITVVNSEDYKKWCNPTTTEATTTTEAASTTEAPTTTGAPTSTEGKA